MARALELAALARGRTSPNPMVGAVLVRDGEVVGEGHHERAGGAHAEVVALAAAGGRARGADLYVNLEPCSHHGRTPPCADALLAAGVARVFAAMGDPDPRVSGRGFARLREGGVTVSVGMLGEEARRLNEVHCTFVGRGRPHVTLKLGMSLDGRIATRTGESRWITDEAARELVHRMRDTADAILVGIGTVLADDPSLTTRLPGGGGRNPHRVVVDSHLRIPLRSRLLTQRARGKTILVACPGAPRERAEELRAAGAEVLVVPGGRRRVDIAAVVGALGGIGITSLLVEGGSEIAASFIASGVVDKLVAFVAPIIIGGKEAPAAVGGAGVAALADAPRLQGVRWEPVGGNLMVVGHLTEVPCSPA